MDALYSKKYISEQDSIKAGYLGLKYEQNKWEDGILLKMRHQMLEWMLS